MAPTITQESANIFRITHRENIPWIFENGLYCPDSPIVDPNFVSIGHKEIIERRRTLVVPIPPGGTFADYVPFYFTPYSPMLYTIVTGYGVPHRSRDEIVIMRSSLPILHEAKKAFVFSDQHAVTLLAEFYRDLADLDRIAWDILGARDFKRDPSDPLKFERYQAEALVHESLGLDLIEEFVCYDQAVRDDLRAKAAERDIGVVIRTEQSWYL